MILKYQKDNVWGFIDNVRQAAHEDLDIDYAVRVYEEKQKTMPCEKGYQDPSEFINGERLSENIVKCNKAFMTASQLPDEGINIHSENLLNVNIVDFPATSILLYLENCKEYDAVLLVTNQKAYLMNDNGQTIERLN